MTNNDLGTVRIGVVHKVKAFNYETGYGVTYCQVRIGPGAVVDAGRVECKLCIKAIKKSEK